MSTARNKWLDAAEVTFQKYGYQKTSLEAVAQQAQKAKGAIYYHFGSKERLFEELVLKDLEKVKRTLEEVFLMEKADAKERIRFYMLARMKALYDSPHYRETLRPEFYEHHRFMDAQKEALAQWEIGQILSLLERGVLAGDLQLPGELRVYAEVLVMLLQGLEADFFLKGNYDRLEPHFDNLIAIITRGISPCPPN